MSTPREGLPLEREALAELDQFQASDNPSARQQLNLAADTLFDSLARSYMRGATTPLDADPEWRMAIPDVPNLTLLHERLNAGASPSALLHPLLPQTREYAALRDELSRVTAETASARDANGLSREARIEKLRASLERLRWLPRQLESDRLEVRIPQAEALLYRGNSRVSSHLIIVGAKDMPTPSFHAVVTSITINPSWTPPSTIVHNELIPRFARNPADAAHQGFDVLDANGGLVDLDTVDWSARPFPYTLRQRPGARNALGRVRFDIPNPYAIYLHDTPNRDLFARANRTLSHGCVRVQDPIGLAEALLADPDWTRAALEAEIESGESRLIAVAAPTPVYLLYITATLNSDGAVDYYDDVYRRDARVVAALDAPDAALVALRQERHARCAA